MDKSEKRRKRKEKLKRALFGKRLALPPNKRHKSKKAYRRDNKVKPYEVESD